MKLLRLASVHLTGLSTPDSDEATINVQAFGSTSPAISVDVQSVTATRNAGSLRIRVLLAAHVDLGEGAVEIQDGSIRVPEAPRQEAEDLLRLTADALSVAERCGRSVSSPMPFLGLMPTTEAEIQQLSGPLRLEGVNAAIGDVWSPMDRRVVGTLIDRRDGAALLADALSSTSAAGAYRDIVRLFERAFGTHKGRLPNLLFDFLRTSGAGFGYSRDETRALVHGTRNRLSHAARANDFLLESHARPLIPRARQAAYDVISNKRDWGAPTSDRREVWRPQVGLTPDGVPFITRGHEAKFEYQALDSFGAFPWDMSVAESELPHGWWTPSVDPTLASGTLVVREPNTASPV